MLADISTLRKAAFGVTAAWFMIFIFGLLAPGPFLGIILLACHLAAAFLGVRLAMLLDRSRTGWGAAGLFVPPTVPLLLWEANESQMRWAALATVGAWGIYMLGFCSFSMTDSSGTPSWFPLTAMIMWVSIGAAAILGARLATLYKRTEPVWTWSLLSALIPPFLLGLVVMKEPKQPAPSSAAYRSSTSYSSGYSSASTAGTHQQLDSALRAMEAGNDPLALLLAIAKQFPEGVWNIPPARDAVKRAGQKFYDQGGMEGMRLAHRQFAVLLSGYAPEAYAVGWDRHLESLWDGVGDWLG